MGSRHSAQFPYVLSANLPKRRIDPGQGLGFHLHDRQVDIGLRIGLGVISLIRPVPLRGAPGTLQFAHPVRQFVRKIAAAGFEHGFQFGVPTRGARA